MCTERNSGETAKDNDKKKIRFILYSSFFMPVKKKPFLILTKLKLAKKKIRNLVKYAFKIK